MTSADNFVTFPPDSWRPCSVCGGPTSRHHDTHEGTTLEESVSCHAGCYDFTFAYGNVEVRVGSRVWGWRWRDAWLEVISAERLLAPAMRDIFEILRDAQTDAARQFGLYRVAADRAEDADDPSLAAGLRWLADKMLCPYMSAVDGLCGWLAGSGDQIRRLHQNYSELYHSCLPTVVWRRIEIIDFPSDAPWKLKGLCVRADFPTAVLVAARAAGVGAGATSPVRVPPE